MELGLDLSPLCKDIGEHMPPDVERQEAHTTDGHSWHMNEPDLRDSLQ